MVTARPYRLFTTAEYLRVERDATFKSEFVRGELFAMVGGTLAHSLVITNTIAVLRAGLGPHGCRVFDSNLRLYVAVAEMMTYPDVSVICGAPEFFEAGPKDTITNPSLIVEVLSPSTEAYDRGEKFVAYRSLASLQHYVLIDPRTPRIDVFSAPDWLPSSVTSLDDVAPLALVGTVLPLRDVYAGVEPGAAGPPRGTT